MLKQRLIDVDGVADQPAQHQIDIDQDDQLLPIGSSQETVSDGARTQVVDFTQPLPHEEVRRMHLNIPNLCMLI